jgi:hypothetical protein
MSKLHDASPKQQGDTFGTVMAGAFLIVFFVFVLPAIFGLLGG